MTQKTGLFFQVMNHLRKVENCVFVILSLKAANMIECFIQDLLVFCTLLYFDYCFDIFLTRPKSQVGHVQGIRSKGIDHTFLKVLYHSFMNKHGLGSQPKSYLTTGLTLEPTQKTISPYWSRQPSLVLFFQVSKIYSKSSTYSKIF